jgi:hypothetical protein
MTTSSERSVELEQRPNGVQSQFPRPCAHRASELIGRCSG